MLKREGFLELALGALLLGEAAVEQLLDVAEQERGDDHGPHGDQPSGALLAGFASHGEHDRVTDAHEGDLDGRLPAAEEVGGVQRHPDVEASRCPSGPPLAK